jgi:hypothetical protein
MPSVAALGIFYSWMIPIEIEKRHQDDLVAFIRAECPAEPCACEF